MSATTPLASAQGSATTSLASAQGSALPRSRYTKPNTSPYGFLHKIFALQTSENPLSSVEPLDLEYTHILPDQRVYVLYGQAIEQFDKREFFNALSTVHSALALKNTSPWLRAKLYLLKAIILYDKDDNRKAIAAANAGLAIKGAKLQTQGELLFIKVRTLFYLDDYDTAVQAIDEGLKIPRLNPYLKAELYLKKALAHSRNNELEEGLAVIKQALDLLSEKHDLKMPFILKKLSISRNRGPVIQRLFSLKSVLFLRLERWADVISAADAGLKMSAGILRTKALLLLRKATACRHQGQHSNALKAIDTALALPLAANDNNISTKLYREKAYLHLALQEWEEAIATACLGLAYKNSEEHVKKELYYIKTTALIKMQKWDEALEAADAGLAIRDPDSLVPQKKLTLLRQYVLDNKSGIVKTFTDLPEPKKIHKRSSSSS